MITKETYSRRRLELMRRMSQGIAIIHTAQENERTTFHPDKNFYYLTGLAEPKMVLVLVAGDEMKSILFCEEISDATTLWIGERIGTERVQSEFGLDEAYPIEKFPEKILEFLPGQKTIFVPYPDKSLVANVFKWIEKMNDVAPHVFQYSPDVCDVCKPLAKMRLIKDVEEIELMRTVANISARGHIKVMQSCGSLTEEQELEAVFHKYCRDNGCDPLHAYPTIVAGEERACVLHYTENDCPLFGGDLVLVDAGAERDEYVADITRTFPVNGPFREPQRLLYQLVLDAQLAAIAQIRPGNTYQDPHIAAVTVLVNGLVELGLLTGDVQELIQEGLTVKGYGVSYKKFFPHRTSHWIGLNVHDVGDYVDENGEYVVLEPGMVLTVEPGLYIPPKMEGVPEKYCGIGIRIEDDILVTQDGHEVLSARVPKTIEEIETLMRG